MDDFFAAYNPVFRIMNCFLLIWTGLVLLMNLGYMAYTGALAYILPAMAIYAGILVSARGMKLRSSAFIVLLFLLAFLSRLAVALSVETPPVSDFKTLNDAAFQFASGDYSFNRTPYFSKWAYQTGYVVYAGSILRLTGGSLIALKAANCIYMAASAVLVYLLAKKCSSEQGARFASVAYLFYPANFFMAPVLTNQHLSLFLLYLSLYVLMTFCRSCPGCMAAGFLAALSQAVRPDAFLLALAYLVVLVGRLWKALRHKSPCIILIKKAACYFVIYALAGFLLSLSVKAAGINPQGLSNKDPLWKLAVGLNHNAYGVLSTEDCSRILSIRDDRLRTQAELEAIKSRAFNEAYRLPVTLIVKQGLLWADYEDLYWGFHHIHGEARPLGWLDLTVRDCLDILKKLDKGFYFLTFMLFGTAVLKLMPGKKQSGGLIPSGLSPTLLLAMAMLFVSISVFSVIEIQVRYRYLLMPALLIVVSHGFDKLLSKLSLWPNSPLSGSFPDRSI